VISIIEDGGCKHPSEGIAVQAAACEDLRGGIDLVAGDAEVIELSLGKMRQLTRGRTVLLIGMDTGKNKSDEHGNSPKAEAMVAVDAGDRASGLGYKTGQD
jgi:hypothetical protein